jgi:putative thioredoxin
MAPKDLPETARERLPALPYWTVRQENLAKSALGFGEAPGKGSFRLPGVSPASSGLPGRAPDRPRNHSPADCKSDFQPPIRAQAVLEQAPIRKTPDEDTVTIVEQSGGPAPQTAADLIKETTTQTFVKDVIEESKRQPVLLDFWAPWCGPCRQLTPIIEKAVRAAKGKVKLVKMNIDEHPAIPGQMGIQSIPAVIAFVNGQPADGFMGAVPESQVTAFINKLTAGMPATGEPNIAEILQEAEAVLVEGDPTAAASIYAEVLAADATNIAALAGLAKCYMTTGALEQAKQTLAMVPESKRGEAAVKAVQVSIDLAEQAKALGPVTELEQKVAANPLDHQARFDLATALNASGKRSEAIHQLLEIVKRDRKWNEDGARKQLVQFFEAWGPTDEATVDGRKRLSTILFS